MRLAAGKYVYFLDSDDYVDVKTLAVSYNICEEKQLDVICFTMSECMKMVEILCQISEQNIRKCAMEFRM